VSKRSRRIVVDGVPYQWSVLHHHHSDRRTSSEEVLSFCGPAQPRRIVFTAVAEPPRIVSDGVWFAHHIATSPGAPLVNLNEPGVVAQLIRMAQSCSTSGRDVDGWELLTNFTVTDEGRLLPITPPGTVAARRR